MLLELNEFHQAEYFDLQNASVTKSKAKLRRLATF